MSGPNRPASRWSTSLSITTKSTGATNQTVPLITVRRKLLRQSANTQKSLSKRLTKSRNDIEELFKLYYSNDVKFDTFQRQIVTGTRIPTARAPSVYQHNPPPNSTNAFSSKHCVSREQFEAVDLNCTNQQQQPTTKRSGQIRTENNSTINPPVPSPQPIVSPPTEIPEIQILPETSPSAQQNELCDSSLVKSVAFLGDDFNESPESTNTKTTKPIITQLGPTTSKSSLLAMLPGPPPPSLLFMNNNRKDPSVLSHTSLSAANSAQQQSRPAMITGSAVIVRQRSPTKQSWNRQRAKSSTALSTNSSSQQPLIAKPRSPSISSPLLIQPDMPEFPVFIGTSRVVSIPSKCSRYVLVTFPEVPLRYNAPSYVERLLLPERFPTLFHNIIQSYDHHLTNIPSDRSTK